MIKRLLAISFVVVCLMFSILGSASAYQSGKAYIGDWEFTIKICETPQEKAKGLAGTKYLADNQGMLFPFEVVEEQIFWMKGMLIPIDIIWIKEGKIVHIQENVPPASVLQNNLPTYGQNILADMVLEIQAGLSKKLDFELGQKVIVKYQ